MYHKNQLLFVNYESDLIMAYFVIELLSISLIEKGGI